jgi:hypothetical protein
MNPFYLVSRIKAAVFVFLLSTMILHYCLPEFFGRVIMIGFLALLASLSVYTWLRSDE